MLKSEQKHSLSSDFYSNHSIELTVRKRRGTIKPDELKKQKSSQDYETIEIEEIINMNLDSGKILESDSDRFTYVQKKGGEIKNSFDITILPPVAIRNALPCPMQIIHGHRGHSNAFHNDEIYKFDKGEEKQFHNLGFLG